MANHIETRDENAHRKILTAIYLLTLSKKRFEVNLLFLFVAATVYVNMVRYIK